MPVDKKTLRVGDKFKATITNGSARITAIGVVVRVQSTDILAHFDCTFDLGRSDAATFTPLSDPNIKAVKDAGFDPSDKRSFWLHHSTSIVDEVIQAAETKPEVKAEAKPSVPEDKDSTSEFRSSLKSGERIKVKDKASGKWVEATLLCLFSSEDTIIFHTDQKDSAFADYAVAYWYPETQLRIKAACEALDISLPDNRVSYVGAHSSNRPVERIDVDPFTLKAGDVVELSWNGKVSEATVLSSKGTYDVVFHSAKESWWSENSSNYGDAQTSARELGLATEGSRFLGWRPKDGSDSLTVKRLVKRAKPIPPKVEEKKEPVYLDLTKEDLQPGDRIMVDDQEVIVCCATKTSEYFYNDLLVAQPYVRDPWHVSETNPFAVAAKELGIDTTKYDCLCWKKSGTKATSIDRSRRFDPKTLKPGQRVEIEIVDENKAYRATATVVLNSGTRIDYLFDTAHSSPHFKASPCRNKQAYTDTCRMLGLDAAGPMIRDMAHSFRVVKQLTTTYLSSKTESLKQGDRIEIEIEGRGGAVLKRRATYLVDAAAGGWCWVDAEIVSTDTRHSFRSLRPTMAETASADVVKAAADLGLDSTSKQTWLIDGNGSNFYKTKLIRVISHAPKPEIKADSIRPDVQYVSNYDPSITTAVSGVRVEIKKSDHIHKGTIIQAAGQTQVVLDTACKSCTRPDIGWPSGTSRLQLKVEAEAARFGLEMPLDKFDTLYKFPEIRLLGEKLNPIEKAVEVKTEERLVEAKTEEKPAEEAKPVEPEAQEPKESQALGTFLIAGAALLGSFMSQAAKAPSVRVAVPEDLPFEEVETISEAQNVA